MSKRTKEKKSETLPPRFNLELIGGNGNAFMIMGLFQRGARRAGWTQDQIDSAFEEMKSGDYDNLLGVVMKYTDVY